MIMLLYFYYTIKFFCRKLKISEFTELTYWSIHFFKISEQAPFMVMIVLVIFSIKSCVERHIWIITRGDLAISCIYSTNEV